MMGDILGFKMLCGHFGWHTSMKYHCFDCMCKEEGLNKTEARCQIVRDVDIPKIHGEIDMTNENYMNEIKVKHN